MRSLHIAQIDVSGAPGGAGVNANGRRAAAAPGREPARQTLLRYASLVVLVVAWQVLSMFVDSTTLPSPLRVLESLGRHIASGELPWHLSITLYRVAIAFALAMLIGTAVGLWMGRRDSVDSALDGLLVLGLNIPALVTIILCYIWFGLSEVAAITAVAINKIPTVVVTVREGARALSNELAEVGAVFGVPRAKTLNKIVLPQLYPYLLAAARSGLSLIWKIVLVVELLGRSNGVGFQLSTYFHFFDISSILAYTIAFAAVVMGIEALVMRPLERRIAHWRQT